MKSLLVIGGTGFFGKSILDAFNRGLLNHWDIKDLILMARNTSKLRKECAHLINSNVQLVDGDITVTETLPSADYVIHAAASTDLSDYLLFPEDQSRNIQLGVLNYCKLAHIFHQNSKILYVSSGAVYGVQPPELYGIPEDFFGDNFGLMDDGKRDYAIAKRGSELLVSKLGGVGLNVSIARCFAFVGPWLPRNQHFAIGNFIADGLNGTDIFVKAKRKVFRSYMYADDLVRWLMVICDSSSNDCQIYNVGSDVGVTLNELAETISKKMHVGVTKSSISVFEIDRYVPSIEKAKRELGLTITFDLDLAIQETVNGILKNNMASLA